MATESGTILVIDDDPEARAALRWLLSESGFAVVEASDGKHAIHYLTSSLPEPALIIADLAMPDMTGWELINVLQAYVRLSSIPVLVISGHGLHEEPVREEGIVEFFPKPVDPQRFLAAVQRHALTSLQRDARRRAATKKLAHSPF